jgi:hypothetical protein
MVNFAQKNHDSSNSRRKMIFIAAAVAAVLLIAIAAVFTWRVANSPVKSDGFQLIKLTSGEIYIGKLNNPSSDDYVVLNQVYTQSGSDASQKDDQAQDENSELLLTRLSASVAKPEDTVYISRDKIVYWANLQSDSKIVNAIKNDK